MLIFLKYGEPLYLSTEDAKRRSKLKGISTVLVVLVVALAGSMSVRALGAVWVIWECYTLRYWQVPLVICLGCLLYLIALRRPSFRRVALGAFLLGAAAAGVTKVVL